MLFGEALLFIAGSALVGAALGALDAACTGGDVLEGAVSGLLTGAVSSACVFFTAGLGTPLATAGAAGVVSTIVDAGVQYAFHGEVDLVSALETGATAAVGALFPVFPGLKNNYINAFGSLLANSEFAVIVTITDIILKHIINSNQTQKNNNKTAGRGCGKSSNLEQLY